MKTYLKLFVTVFFILIAVRTVKADYYSVSGTVRYADNNEIVTSGFVNAYDVVSCELVGQGQIEPTGDYLINMMALAGERDLIGFPNLEPETDNFLPTGYPDRLYSSEYVHVTVNGNVTGIDIYVQRAPVGSGGMPFTSNISGIILDKNNLPLKDAIVYSKRGNAVTGYGVTNSKGEYIIRNIPVGNYTLSANRVSNKTNEISVNLTENGLSNVNFIMEKLSPIKNNISPVTYKLSQNFPNPFNPSTTIRYTIPVSGLVTINVYNSVGQEVASLVNEVQNAGTYEMSFGASALSSGVYYYKLTSGTFTATKKMTLIK